MSEPSQGEHGNSTNLPRAAIHSRDLVVVLKLLALWPLAWLVPERRWEALVMLAARSAWSRGRGRKWRAMIQAAGGLDSTAARQIVLEMGVNRILKQLQLLRWYRPGRGWRPRINIEGQERLDRALAAGRGVILWNSPFYFSDLAGKIGIHEAGYAVTHLSMPEHGFSSNSRFGVRWLNPIFVRVEDRHLRARVVIDPADPKRGRERIGRALEGNGIIWITAVRGAARRPAAIRILNACFRLGLGAPLLAYETGAALLPVFTIRKPDGSFRLFVEEPIPVSLEKPRIEAAMAAIETLAKRTEDHVRAAPGQWCWWFMEPIRDEGTSDAQSMSK